MHGGPGTTMKDTQLESITEYYTSFFTNHFILEMRRWNIRSYKAQFQPVSLTPFVANPILIFNKFYVFV